MRLARGQRLALQVLDVTAVHEPLPARVFRAGLALLRVQEEVLLALREAQDHLVVVGRCVRIGFGQGRLGKQYGVVWSERWDGVLPVGGHHAQALLPGTYTILCMSMQSPHSRLSGRTCQRRRCFFRTFFRDFLGELGPPPAPSARKISSSVVEIDRSDDFFALPVNNRAIWHLLSGTLML